jgi:hypothetical protein
VKLTYGHVTTIGFHGYDAASFLPDATVLLRLEVYQLVAVTSRGPVSVVIKVNSYIWHRYMLLIVNKNASHFECFRNFVAISFEVLRFTEVSIRDDNKMRLTICI